LEKCRNTLSDYLRALFPKHFPIARCKDD